MSTFWFGYLAWLATPQWPNLHSTPRQTPFVHCRLNKGFAIMDGWPIFYRWFCHR
jgi:hypothetical protein